MHCTQIRSFLCLASLFFLVLLSGCRKQPADTTLLVWSGDPVQISTYELQESFLLRPKFPASLKGRAALQAHLQGMIQHKYLAWSAAHQGLCRDPRMSDRLHWVRHKAMREQLFKKEISAGVHISEQELRTAFVKRNRTYTVRHLYVQTREEAQQWRQRLVAGLSFERAAQAVYADIDEDMAASNGQLPPFTWGEMDPAFEAAVFAMKPGDLSEPVATQWGYHIIRVDGLDINPIITENDYIQDHHNIERIIRQRKEDTLATRYVAEVMAGLRVAVKAPAFSYLVNQARQALRDRDPSWPKNQAINDVEWQTIAGSLQEKGNQLFMTWRDGQWTLADFIRRFQAIPPLYRPHLQNPELFEKELRNLIRDEFLNIKAEKLGLADDPYVEQKVREAKQDMAAAAMRQNLVASVTVDEGEVQRYYQKHLAKLEPNPGETMWKEIQRRALASKQDSVVSAFVWNWQKNVVAQENDSLFAQVLRELGGEKASFIAVWQPPPK